MILSRHSLQRCKQTSGGKRFSKEVSNVISSRHIGHNNFAVFDEFSNEVMSSIDVLSARVILGVVRRINSE